MQTPHSSSRPKMEEKQLGEDCTSGKFVKDFELEAVRLEGEKLNSCNSSHNFVQHGNTELTKYLYNELHPDGNKAIIIKFYSTTKTIKTQKNQGQWNILKLIINAAS